MKNLLSIKEAISLKDLEYFVWLLPKVMEIKIVLEKNIYHISFQKEIFIDSNQRLIFEGEAGEFFKEHIKL